MLRVILSIKCLTRYLVLFADAVTSDLPIMGEHTRLRCEAWKLSGQCVVSDAVQLSPIGLKKSYLLKLGIIEYKLTPHTPMSDKIQNQNQRTQAVNSLSANQCSLPPHYGEKTILVGTHNTVWWEIRDKKTHAIIGDGATLKLAREDARRIRSKSIWASLELIRH